MKHLPRIRETWESLDIGKPVFIKKINKGRTIAEVSLAKANATVYLSRLIRRHFRDQAERDAAPAIPPVVGRL